MQYFIALNHLGDYYEIGLFCEGLLVSSIKQEKYSISKHAISLIEQLLIGNNITVSDLQFIAINYGPGPFNTLRALVTIANALSFATKIPLIGINALALLTQQYNHSDAIVVALLNAYNQDVYYGFQNKNDPLIIGCKPYTVLFAELKEQYPENCIHFIGQGTVLYATEISALFNQQAYMPALLPEFGSTAQLGAMALGKWNNNETVLQITPLYLKQLQYKPALQN